MACYKPIQSPKSPPSSISITFVILGFVAGAGICATLPRFIEPWLIALILLGGFSCCFPAALRLLGCLLITFGLGLATGSAHLRYIIDSQLPSDFENKELRIVVRVDSMPVDSNGVVRFTGEVESLQNNVWGSGLQGKRIRLAWYKRQKYGFTPKNNSSKVGNTASILAQNISPGQHLELSVRLKRPRGLANPKGFDYQAWLLSQKIVATGYVRHSPAPILIAPGSRLNIEYLRYYLNNLLFLNDKDYQHASFLQALMLGDKSKIVAAQWQVLQETGTIHLMAISGLHVGLVAFIAYLTAGCITALMTLTGIRRGLPTFAPMFAIVAALVYSGLAGFSLPTQRALIMVVLVNIAIVFRWRLSPSLLLSIAAALVSIIDPFVFFQQGFWLSFGAVFFLLYSLSGMGESKRWQQFLSAQYAITVGLLLPMTLFSLPISIYAPIANLVAIPVVSVFVIPLILLAAILSFVSPLLAGYLLNCCDLVFGFLWSFLSWLASLDGSYWLTPPSSFIVLAVAVLASLLLLAPRGLALRPLGAVLMIAFILSCFPMAKRSTGYRLTVLDVGQGLALVFSTPTTNWLYDTGAKISDNFDMGSRVIVPFLRNRGIHTIDALVVSHSDNDHSGGVSGVLESFDIPALLAGQPEKLFSLNRSFTQCTKGQAWTADAARIDVLWPNSVDKNSTDNDASCVLLIYVADKKILIPGDISAAVERQLLALPQLKKGIDIIIAPHHGSNTSSSDEFVNTLSPDYVIYSSGYNNRYGHPHGKVMARYNKVDAISFSTANDGAIEIEWDEDGNELELKRERRNRPRLWYR